MTDPDTVHMRGLANQLRDLADNISGRYGADDPLHPHQAGQFRDWRDFVDRVARPLVDAMRAVPVVTADGATRVALAPGAAGKEAMRRFRTVSPYYLCDVLVMMADRISLAPADTLTAMES